MASRWGFPGIQVCADARAQFKSIRRLIGSEAKLASLPVSVRRRLIVDLVHALDFMIYDEEHYRIRNKKLGKKGDKPGARRLTVFVDDLCEALRTVGIHAAVNREQEKSLAQRLGNAILKSAGRAPNNSLEWQVRRWQARKKRKVEWQEVQLNLPPFGTSRHPVAPAKVPSARRRGRPPKNPVSSA